MFALDWFVPKTNALHVIVKVLNAHVLVAKHIVPKLHVELIYNTGGIMGATSMTGISGPGESNGKFKPHLTAGCGSKGPKPNPCGPFSCAFADDYHKQCGCPVEKVKRGCAVKHKVGQSKVIRVGASRKLKVCG
jgi:hypothetical protein